ncbi:MAG: SCP2 sterol-binding domain-containing protein [Sutterellaceae bacterium]|nr:SCP2 sterol-binding domain-containing protein [Burkholderiaceae bacterium]MDW8429207.1 SCP2 sterol-binding domain-containing protein [Sutterellaceae bacterium]
MDDFLTMAWAERYRAAWNADVKLTEGLRGFSALIEYGWADSAGPSVFLRVQDGRVVDIANSAVGEPDFVMKASAENWRRMRDGTLSGRAALLTKKLQFKGSMITAMKYMGPFERSIELLGRV